MKVQAKAASARSQTKTAEIRSQIFELLLIYEDKVRAPMLGLSVVYWEEWHLQNPLHPSSLFFASKQIRKDAMNFYFRCNHITLGSSGQALPHHHIPRTNRGSLRSAPDESHNPCATLQLGLYDAFMVELGFVRLEEPFRDVWRMA